MAQEQRALSERKKQILKAIVDAQIEGGGPVGSKAILAAGGMNCSSATIRNEMAELEEMGYLEQPHASAGRVPSELGYRFYVDTLIEHYAMTTHEIAQINNLLRVKMGELDQILKAASNLASNLTNYTGIAIQARTGSVITKFEGIYLEPGHFILVAVASSGAVKTKHVRIDGEVDQETVSKVAGVLNDKIAGLSADKITLPILMELETQMGTAGGIVGPVMKVVYDLLSELDAGGMQVSGIDHLLQYPEYSDTEQFRELLGTLEKKDDILDLVATTAGEDDVNVLIGSESRVKVMNNSALVFKPIVQDGKTLGAIGVLGPRRMDYAKVLATLEGLSGNIENLIKPNKQLQKGGKTDG